MNLAHDLFSFDPKGLFLCDPIKNTVMPNSNFSRVLYSEPSVTFAGLHLLLSIEELKEEQYYQKTRLIFDPNKYSKTVNIVTKIENLILDSVDSRKRRISKLGPQFQLGVLKSIIPSTEVFSSKKYVLKISGVWETETDYGLTYKIIDINHQ
jgi:hypothetical protein